MYFELLKDWCDTLIRLQVTEIKNKKLYGGIMCPSCARIHGRCGDAIFPMMYMAARTGEDKYLECAKLLFHWSENMTRPDGSYNNDTNSDWKGITVFASIQLGEALYYHGDLLDSKTRTLWLKRFQTSIDYLLTKIEKIGGNINYPLTCAAAMTIAYKLLKADKYADKARKLAHGALSYFTEEGLLFGEGKPNDGISEKGCRPVDLGYNVEESLPGLLTYALYYEDEEVLEMVMKSMETHLLFMLPDGAWDNSWGTRNNKWSYWGSRTSDGCQAGYGLLADRNPLFGEAVYRNTLLLRECTHDGLLYGGPMYYSAGEPPCVHHTFCHAKAIAIMLEHGIEPSHSVKLPRETAEGIRYFPSIHVGLIAKGDWRMTVSDYDFEYSEEGHATGGAITMLWSKTIGPVLAGTMSKYYLVESNNMQLPNYTKDICLTPRIEVLQENTYYRNINDKSATVEYKDNDKVVVTAIGKLVDGRQQGNEPYQIQYELNDTEIVIKGHTSAQNAKFYIPVISQSGNAVKELSENKYYIETQKGMIHLISDCNLKILKGFAKKKSLEEEEPTKKEVNRIFNPVGGFEAVPFYIDIKPGEEFRVKIEVIQTSF
ncbi:MAG TPA: hypothetical protein DEG06_04430 [Lachnospiraceae bacterium]|jgi:hypothetical protein|nr:hypothetical protein [Lachnospiraceae bacterium]HCA69120.1 hypothetical protein [Lachnospiraceae bacterium]HCM13106.1 hypothetical protein [Lachnospiraceae bacterium]